MTTVTTTATQVYVNPTHAYVPLRPWELALGLVLVAIIPALFWTSVIWTIASALGTELSWTNLVSLALAIATPPTCIWATLAVRE